MGVLSRSGILAAVVVLLMTLFPQNPPRPESLLTNISSRKTRVLDLSYAINDQGVPWPGDPRWFEAKVNATVEKDGVFTRSFWMLEHYGTHLDAPIHFPPGTVTVDQNPCETIVWARGRFGCAGGCGSRSGLSVACGTRRRLGKAARTNSRGRDRIASDGVVGAMARRATISQSGCPRADALSGIFD